MSRIGRKIIEIPAGVTVTVNDGLVSVTGPKGNLSITVRPEIGVKVEGNILTCAVVIPSRETSAYWGLTRALIANIVLGVVKGFEKKLELVGVGYRAKQMGKDIQMTLGFSHPVDFVAPAGIELKVVDNTNITISGIDRQQVGQVSAQIRKIKKPEPYKGKGIKYSNEVVRRKAGKAGKA